MGIRRSFGYDGIECTFTRSRPTDTYSLTGVNEIIIGLPLLSNSDGLHIGYIFDAEEDNIYSIDRNAPFMLRFPIILADIFDPFGPFDPILNNITQRDLPRSNSIADWWEDRIDGLNNALTPSPGATFPTGLMDAHRIASDGRSSSSWHENPTPEQATLQNYIYTNYWLPRISQIPNLNPTLLTPGGPHLEGLATY